MNIAPDATGRLNASVVEVMKEAGKAINDTFHLNDAGSIGGVSGGCADGVVVLQVSPMRKKTLALYLIQPSALPACLPRHCAWCSEIELRCEAIRTALWAASTSNQN